MIRKAAFLILFVQQATVAAVFAYDAAMRDEKLRRKALPRARAGRGTQTAGDGR